MSREHINDIFNPKTESVQIELNIDILAVLTKL